MFDPKTDGMGIGRKGMGDPNAIFVRKFRWTLEATHLSPYWLRSAQIDFSNKKILIVYAEVWTPPGTIPAIEWVESMKKKTWPDEALRFVTYDGCGNELYRYDFTGIEIIEDKSNFDYADEDIGTREVAISFSDFDFEVQPQKSKTEIELLQDEIDNLRKELHKYQEQKLEIQNSAVPINFMHDKTWLPGRSPATCTTI